MTEHPSTILFPVKQFRIFLMATPTPLLYQVKNCDAQVQKNHIQPISNGSRSLATSHSFSTQMLN